jgi:CSLREA domain-containing protein
MSFMKARHLLTFALAILLLCWVPANSQDVNGLLFTVNSTADTRDAFTGDRICADENGRCTLRAAVEETNSNATRDAIIFDLPQPSVIELTFGELFLVQSLDILGPGARRLTIQRAAGTINSRIFHTAPTQLFVNIRGLTIRGGNDLDGGGLFVESGGVVGLFDSAVSGNNGQRGGAISSSGTLTVVRCLIHSNTASVTGGGIANVGSTHQVTIVNSTITGNTGASAGGIYNEGGLLLVNDTINNNTGTAAVNGILNTGQGIVQVLNTIIGRDTALGNTLQGSFQSGGNNIVTKANGSTGFTNGVNGDQVSNNNIIDPLVGPLADNGGQTDTFSLLTGSPAIDHGNACVLTGQCPLLPGIQIQYGRRDQRRLMRYPFATEIDVGAFDTETFGGSSLTGLSFGCFGCPANRHAGALVELTNPETLERRYTRVRLTGRIQFNYLPEAAAYVIEIRSKRAGMPTPIVFAFDR